MSIVKKLKFDIHGNGNETIIKISINSHGLFFADIPNYIKLATNITCSRETNLLDAINVVNNAVYEYKKLLEVKSMVILIEFNKENPPFLNSGLGMTFNYGVAEKIVFGKYVRYKYCSIDNNGEFHFPGNNFPTHKCFFEKGICGGISTEIEYTKDNYNTIIDIHNNLEQLCVKLNDICNSETNLLQLVESKIKSLNIVNKWAK